jgi:hypothetical protein
MKENVSYNKESCRRNYSLEIIEKYKLNILNSTVARYQANCPSNCIFPPATLFSKIKMPK